MATSSLSHVSCSCSTVCTTWQAVCLATWRHSVNQCSCTPASSSSSIFHQLVHSTRLPLYQPRDVHGSSVRLHCMVQQLGTHSILRDSLNNTFHYLLSHVISTPSPPTSTLQRVWCASQNALYKLAVVMLRYVSRQNWSLHDGKQSASLRCVLDHNWSISRVYSLNLTWELAAVIRNSLAAIFTATLEWLLSLVILSAVDCV